MPIVGMEFGGAGLMPTLGLVAERPLAVVEYAPLRADPPQLRGGGVDELAGDLDFVTEAMLVCGGQCLFGGCQGARQVLSLPLQFGELVTDLRPSGLG